MTDQRLFKLLSEVSELKGRKIGDMIIGHYMDQLQDIPFATLYEALMSFVQEGSYGMPSINEIKKRCGYDTPELLSDQDKAQAIADRIRQAVPKFGYMQADKAKEWMGNDAWNVCQQFGGFVSLCETETEDDFNHLVIQIRKSAEVYVKRHASGSHLRKLELDAPQSNKTAALITQISKKVSLPSS